MARSRTNRSADIPVEDPGGWQEIPRSEEVKNYSQALRQLWRRTTLTRILSLVLGVYIAFVVFYTFGGPGIPASTTSEGQKVFILTSVMWFGFLLFFVAPVVMFVFRPRRARVSRRTTEPVRRTSERGD